MSNLMKKDDRENNQSKSAGKLLKSDIDEYRKRISDNDYLDHAIKKIATDLSHYLTK